MKVRARVVVTGRVQGVFFRASAREEALRLDLAGWIRNRPDGRSVEAEVEGEAGAVNAFVDWCRKGPPMARVQEVAVTYGEPTGAPRPFEVRY